MQKTTEIPQAEELKTASELPMVTGRGGSIDKLRLLEISISEEHYFIDAHQKRINFYSSLISAILAATIAGTMKATRSIDFLLLCVGPILISFLSWTAKKACLRFYQRFLEAITVRGKLEAELGFAEKFTNENAAYWKGEPLIPTRHLNDRKESGNSESFVRGHVSRGDPSGPPRLFTAFLLIGVVLLIALVLIAYFGVSMKR